MNILLGVDIGTTKLCVVAFDADSGAVLAVRSATNDTAIPGEPDASEQDTFRIIDCAIGLIGEIVSVCDRTKIAGIGITGQMHGVLLTAPDGHPITPLINWQDQRGNRKYQPTGHTFAEEVCLQIGDNLLSKTGTTPATGYGAVTLFRLAKNSEIPQNATALTIHDFLVKHLTGASVTDPTDAASWGIYNVQNETGWLPNIEKLLDFPIGLLPPIRPTGSIAGNLLPEIASKIELPNGIPVGVALGDNQASFLGSVPSIAESVLFNIGTGGQMSIASNKFTYCLGLDTRPLVSKKWLQVGASLCGGSAFKILANFFSSVGSELFNQNASPESLYDKMTSLAELLTDDDDIPKITPYFYGTRIDSSCPASITAIRASNFTPAYLTRAMIRGIVDELVTYYEMSCLSKSQPDFIVGSGNGFRRNSVLRHEFASYFGSQILLPPNKEEAAVGAALAAGVGVGIFSDWNDAGRKLYSNSETGEQKCRK